MAHEMKTTEIIALFDLRDLSLNSLPACGGDNKNSAIKYLIELIVNINAIACHMRLSHNIRHHINWSPKENRNETKHTKKEKNK